MSCAAVLPPPAAHRCPNPAACSANRTLLLACSSEASGTNMTNVSDNSRDVKDCRHTGGARLTTAGDGTSFAEQQCVEGYTGNLCGKCVPGHGSMRPFSCRRCYPRGTLVAMYVIASLCMLGFMKLVCWFTIKDSYRHAPSDDGSGDAGPAEPSHLLRQLVLHGQYTLIIASVQAADAWPPSITKPLQALAWVWSPASPETLAPDCLVTAGASVPPSVAKVVFYLIMPLVLLLLLLLLETCLHFVKAMPCIRARQGGLAYFYTRASRGSLKDRLVAAGMVAMFFFLPSIVRTAFGLFACIMIDKPDTKPYLTLALGAFWKHDTDQLCFAGWHRGFALGLGIPLLLLVCAVPLFSLWKTLPNRHLLASPAWRKHYSFLVQYYKPRYIYWEAVVTTQTIGLVALSVFSYTLGPYYQALVMNVAIACIGLLLAFVRPLAHRDALNVAFASMSCLFLTSYSAMAFAQTTGRGGGADLELSNAEAAAIPLLMGVWVVGAYVAFVAWVLWKLVKLIDWRRCLRAICNLCNRLCPCCPQCFQPAHGAGGSSPACQGVNGVGRAGGTGGGGASGGCVLAEKADAAITLPGGDQHIQKSPAKH